MFKDLPAELLVRTEPDGHHEGLTTRENPTGGRTSAESETLGAKSDEVSVEEFVGPPWSTCAAEMFSVSKLQRSSTVSQ